MQNISTNCPRCGGAAVNVHGGAHRMDDQGNWRSLASLLRDIDASGEDFARLIRIVKHAQAANVSAEEVAREVAEETPFSALADWMLGQQSASIAAWLAVLITVLIWLVPNPFGSDDSALAPTVNVTVNDGPSEAEIEGRIREALQKAQSPAKKQARNDPCACASGRKYKRCCGAPAPQP